MLIFVVELATAISAFVYKAKVSTTYRPSHYTRHDMWSVAFMPLVVSS